jgi:hypothetical protein
MNKKTFLILLACCTISSISISQNLITNPSFEEHSECLDSNAYYAQSINSVVFGWNQLGSAHYANACGKLCKTVMNGKKLVYEGAHTGNGYVILNLLEYMNASTRDTMLIGLSPNCIYSELTAGMVKGDKYDISMYVRLDSGSESAVPSIGVSLWKTIDSSKFSLGMAQLSLQDSAALKDSAYKDLKEIHSVAQTFKYNLDDCAYWHKIEGAYFAKGGEKYIVIGGFVSGDFKHIAILKTKPHLRKMQLSQDSEDVKDIRKEESLMEKGYEFVNPNRNFGIVYHIDDVSVISEK